MTTDRELLEMAAKAAGIELVTPTMMEHGQWNPLTDDGDALRLAVGCCLPLEVEDYQTRVHPLGIVEPHGDDPYAATRRAIVRAAAAIGSAL